MPAPGSSCVPVKVKMRLQAIGLWMFLSIPSIVVTLLLFVWTIGNETLEDDALADNATMAISQPRYEDDVKDEEEKDEDETNNMTVTYQCYENYTVYYPRFEEAQFWIEGVSLIVVGILGLLGNILTLAVLSQSKKTTFNQLLIVLSIYDSLLIVFFILVSASTTVMSSEPHWFIYIFPYILWPLGNISITSTVLMVVAVSTERYLAICRPLQYKPSPIFYIFFVFMTSIGVNFGRFLEFRNSMVFNDKDNSTQPSFEPTPLMADERYIMFSRYWTEIVVIGILPLLALILLNYGIYLKIRKSARFRKRHDGFVMRFTKQNSETSNNHNSVLDNSVVILQKSRSSPREAILRRTDTQDSTWESSAEPSVLRGGSSLESPNGIVVMSRQRHQLIRQQTLPECQTLATSETSPKYGTHLSASPPKGPVLGAKAKNGAPPTSNERSTKVLVGIVVVFLVCHVVRLVIQIDSVVHPSTIGSEHFMYCRDKGLFHSPYAVYILTSFNNLCLVLNSSINFFVYCMAGRRFRTTLVDLLCHKRFPWGSRAPNERRDSRMQTLERNGQLRTRTSRIELNGNVGVSSGGRIGIGGRQLEIDVSSRIGARTRSQEERAV